MTDKRFERRDKMQDIIRRKVNMDIGDMEDNSKLDFDIEHPRNTKWMVITDGDLNLMEKYTRKKKISKSKLNRCKCKKK